ncbi:MAG: cyanoexosortase C [Stenomitos frigidus ULC029]
MKAKNVRPIVQGFWKEGLKTTHGRIILLGLVVVAGYLSFWLGFQVWRSLKGSSSGLLQIAAMALGVYQLWGQRQQLKQQTALEEDRLLGYLLILSGVILFPLCWVSTWSQAMVSALILALVCAVIGAGIVCSCWGLSFFGTYPLSTFLICLGLLPKPAEISRALWQAFTVPELLERFMAWSGGVILRAIGQPAVVDGLFISIRNQAVEVGWGCNGFDMAVTMIVASLVLGLFLKQSWSKIAVIMAIGATLALLSNIPRVALVTVAAVYWGQYWFDFWHDSWGSQIFVSVLFTIYYYVVMAIVKQRSHKNTA